MPRIHRPKQLVRLALFFIVFSFYISACSPELFFPIRQTTPTPDAPPIYQAEVIFRVQVPFNTPANTPIYLELLDEVTGLGLNPIRYLMEAQSANFFSIRLPFQIGTAIKYRYLLGSSPLAIENTAGEKQVRYRIYPVKGPDIVQDIVATWGGKPFSGQTGRIFGAITDQTNGKPVVDVLVSAAGLQTISAADGSFLLDGIPQGTHHLTAYSIHGSYSVFEQGAQVAPEAATQADIQLVPAPLVNVTFILSAPRPPMDIAQVRMIGNLYQLGNTFGDLNGGINTLASRAPLLSKLENGKYRIDLQLPVGFDLRYKYSLGDGFWNAEHRDGRFFVRQLIVPAEDTVIEDTVETWSSGDSAPIAFVARTSSPLPDGEYLSIQFNPYAWLEPIPMWQNGPNEWVIVLTSPLELIGEVGYRYCLNEYCPPSENDQQASAKGTFTKSSDVQYFQDLIPEWPYRFSSETVVVPPAGDVVNRYQHFSVGIELAPSFQPSWSAYLKDGLDQAIALNSNLLVLTPAWTLTQQNPPNILPVPGRDGLWSDWMEQVTRVSDYKVSLALYPQLSSEMSNSDWWTGAQRDLSWWYSWYDRYQTFILHHAKMAEQMNAAAMIIGGPEVAPAFPDGRLPDGSPSGTPDEAENRWREIIGEIRKVFHGEIILALPYYGDFISPPPLTPAFDQIYLLWLAPLPEIETKSHLEITAMTKYMLEKDIRPLRKNTDKPVILGVQYCNSTNYLCASEEDQAIGGVAATDAIQIQENLYNATLAVVSETDWINGFVSRGYFPLAPLADKTPSVYGKPTWNLLWYWYPRLQGELKQRID